MGLYEQGIRALANQKPETRSPKPQLYARSMREIADVLGLSEAEAHWIYTRAITKIKPELEKLWREFGL